MAPLLRKRKRGGHGSEKITTRGRARVGADLLTEKRTSTAGSEKTTTRGREGVGVRPLTRKANGKEDPCLTYGDEEKDDVPADRKTWIEFALAEKAKMKTRCEEAFEKLKIFLENNGLSADEPYKYAMQKLLGGEAMSREVREAIGKYIRQKLGEVKRFLSYLLGVTDWDDTVAGYVIGSIKEVTEHLGVEIMELKEICCKAEEGILKESDRGFKLVKGDYVKDNPTACFSSCDPDNYDDRYVRRYQTPPSSSPVRPLP